MEPLVTTKRMLIWFHGYHSEECTSIRKKLPHFSFTLIVLLNLLSSWLTSFFYIIQFMSIDVEGSIYAIYANGVVISGFYILIVIYLMRFQNRDVFEGLANIYKECKKIIHPTFTSILPWIINKKYIFFRCWRRYVSIFTECK